LKRLLTTTQAANGFGNRFLWACARRSKLLPEGGTPDEDAIAELVIKVREAIEFAQTVMLMERDETARGLWHQVYAELSEGKAGLLGCMIGRSEAQVMRLACIYALLDRSKLIRVEHLKAAIEVWRYCEDSARFIFGDAHGDQVADTILAELRRSPYGLTRTAIRDLFDRHQKTEAVNQALAALAARGQARAEKTPTAGRPTETWFAC
jgi:hypothetical protein